MTLNEDDLNIDFIADAHTILGALPEHGFARAQDAFYALIEGADHDYKVDLVEAYEVLKQDRYPFMKAALPTDFVTTVDKERYYAENIAYALGCDGVIEHYKELDELLEATLKIPLILLLSLPWTVLLKSIKSLSGDQLFQAPSQD